MQNIVIFDIEHTKPILLKHNGKPIHETVVECIYGKNYFTIEGDEFTVKNILMFDMGKDEIIKYATIEAGIWKLEYEYPVFSWLHKILQYGWLLKEDNE